MAVTNNVEVLISCLGGRARFQMAIHMLLAYLCIIVLFNHVIMAFHGTPVPHTCMPVQDTMMDKHSAMSDDSQLVNVSHATCSSTLYFLDGQNKTVNCKSGQWKYAPLYQEKNLVSEFDLVCDNNHLGNLATTVYFVGVMLGGLVFGDLADRFGRLPVILLTLYSSIMLGIATAFSVNYIMFVSLRFITGILMQGLQTSSYTMIMELFVSKHRPYAGAVTECFFGISIMMLAGLAYAIRDWKYLQIAISLPGVLTLFYPWVVPESLRWLIMKGKLEKAEAQIHRICRINKIPVPTEIWAKVKKESCLKQADSPSQEQYNLTTLFRTAQIRKRSLVLFFLWFAISTSYYGLTFQMTSLTSSRYLTFFIGGAVETLTYALTLPVMRRFGRKKPLLACFISAAVFCVAAGIFSNYTSGLGSVIAGLALVGRCAVAGLFGIIFVYTSEIYPTVIRNIGMGACCLWARAGGVIGPQINQWTKALWGVDAVFIFGALVLIAGLLLFFLPETHNNQLPDSLWQAEQTSKEDKPLDGHKALAGAGAGREADKASLLQDRGDSKSEPNIEENVV